MGRRTSTTLAGLSRRDRAILRAVAEGRCTISAAFGAPLTVDGYAAHPPSRLKEEIMTAIVVVPPLTSLDRCDRCDAAAKTRVTLRDGGELQFRNHSRQHADRLHELRADLRHAA